MLFLEFIFCNSASSEKGIPWTSLYCDNRATRLSDCGKLGLRQHYTDCRAAADVRHPSPKDPGGLHISLTTKLLSRDVQKWSKSFEGQTLRNVALAFHLVLFTCLSLVYSVVPAQHGGQESLAFGPDSLPTQRILLHYFRGIVL